MKRFVAIISMFSCLGISTAHATSDGPTEYTNPNQCLDDLIEVLGPSYKLINKDIILKTDVKNNITTYYSNGSTVGVQSNGGCFREPNKANDFNGLLLGAMEKAKQKNHQALETCKVQQGNSVWYKIFAELGPKLKGSKKSTGAER